MKDEVTTVAYMNRRYMAERYPRTRKGEKHAQTVYMLYELPDYIPFSSMLYRKAVLRLNSIRAKKAAVRARRSQARPAKVIVRPRKAPATL